MLLPGETSFEYILTFTVIDAKDQDKVQVKRFLAMGDAFLPCWIEGCINKDDLASFSVLCKDTPVLDIKVGKGRSHRQRTSMRSRRQDVVSYERLVTIKKDEIYEKLRRPIYGVRIRSEEYEQIEGLLPGL